MNNIISKDFYLFCRNMERGLTFAKVHKYLMVKAQETIETDHGRLLLSVPPGTGKSTIISKLLPAWLLGVNPKTRILLVSYGSSLSNSFGKEVRKYMSSPVYKKIFPETVIEGDGKGGTFETTAGGFLKSTGRGGDITGRRCDVAIIDDSIKNSQEAQSDVILDGLWEWASTTLYTRIVPPGSLIVLNTRWCTRDLIGKWSEVNPQWPNINIEALCTDTDIDPLGREIGQAAWPEMYDDQYLNQVKASSPKTFGALYQGNPISEDSVPIKKSSLQASLVESYNKKDRKFISWDTATVIGGDYTVATVWSFNKDSSTIIDVVRTQVEFEGLLTLFDNLNKCYGPVINVVEKASSGHQLIQLRPDKCLASGTIKVADKEKLAESFNYSLKNNNIKFLDTALIHQIEKELVEFPFGTNDDVPLSILHGYKTLLTQELYKLKGSRVGVRQALRGVRQALEPYPKFRLSGKRF